MKLRRLIQIGLFSVCSLFLSFLASEPKAFAVNNCTVCLSEIGNNEKYLKCKKDHRIDQDCLTNQVKSQENLDELKNQGLPCCGEGCKLRIPFADVQGMLNPIEKLALQTRFNKADQPMDQSRSKKEIERLAEGIEESFNPCCQVDGCSSTLDKIEGCNAATCSNAQCKTTFCYLCLEKQGDDVAAHVHAKAHSGDFWEFRNGYVDRYHWLIARKELAHLFKRGVDPSTREAALNSRKKLLQERKMWPLPAGLMADLWIKKLIVSGLSTQDQIEMLQNEYIYRKQIKDVKNAGLVEAELRRLGGKVLASLDVGDANGIGAPRAAGGQQQPPAQAQQVPVNAPAVQPNGARDRAVGIDDPRVQARANGAAAVAQARAYEARLAAARGQVPAQVQAPARAAPVQAAPALAAQPNVRAVRREERAQVQNLAAQARVAQIQADEALAAQLQAEEPGFQAQARAQARGEGRPNAAIPPNANAFQAQARAQAQGEARVPVAQLQAAQLADPAGRLNPVEGNDRRVTRAFAALGNMYQVGRVIWSGVRPGRAMNRVDAEMYCRGLGAPVAGVAPGERRGYKLPTRAEYQALSAAMGKNTPQGYDRNRMPDMRGGQFWSATNVQGENFAAFIGNEGELDPLPQTDELQVRCVYVE